MSLKSSKCIVVVPTHKDTMTSEEERSFRNTLDVLRDWPVTLLLPEGVSPDFYKALRMEEGLQFDIVTLRSGWMGSIEKYNDMALSPAFYEQFQDHDYVLICHLDAWVFRDELQQWMDKGYDYIGAPWFLSREKNHPPLESLMCPRGGNGGFSLRRIDKMIELLSQEKRALSIALFLKGLFFLVRNKRWNFLRIYLRSCREALQDAKAFQKKYNVYEDAMISVFYALLDKTFRVAPPDEAIFFATEVHSEEILNSKLKWRLPFAIHGYDKYLPSAKSIDAYRKDGARNDYSRAAEDCGADQEQGGDAPLVTVATATYNLVKSGRVETFRQCMQSVHDQSYGNIEHIIIDGASTDGTLELIQEYVDKGWCVCYSEKDDGIWDAMYKGHQRAKGRFVNYMNSDDYFSRPDAVEIAVSSMRKEKADWFFSGGTILREDGSGYPFPTSVYGVFHCLGILHQTMFVRTDILRAMDPFRTDHVTRENYLMMLLYLNKIKYAYSRESLVCYREGGFSTNAYGNSNQSRTKDDFARYFYDSIGRVWGMTEDECRSMFCWECFGARGLRYSYALSKKLRDRDLRFAFLRYLAKVAYRARSRILQRYRLALRDVAARAYRKSFRYWHDKRREIF